MSDTTPPEAGWYADPEDAAGERWWNGAGWSDHRRPATVDDPNAASAVYSTPAAPAAAPAAPSGFTFGTGAPAGPRPDPYAAPAPAYGYPPLGSGTPAVPYTPGATYTPPAYGAAPYGGAPTSSNTLAVVGLVLSIVGFFVGLAALAGVILSALGLAQARRREALGEPNSGRGLAMAGLVVGIIACVIGITFFVIYLVFVFSVIPSTGTYT